MRKIVLIGPESTGKTTLANQLAKHYEVPLVEEFARNFIDALNQPYQKADLLKIAKGQLKNEDIIVRKSPNLLICDTDLIVIKIWSTVKYKSVDNWILTEIQSRHYDLYLLCGTDIPWEFDEQREHPEFREELYQLYLNELINYNKNFAELTGNQIIRFEKAVELIDKLME